MPKHLFKPSNGDTWYIFRLRIEAPSLEMYKHASQEQFDQTGFAAFAKEQAKKA
jgi:hypothetical protein